MVARRRASAIMPGGALRAGVLARLRACRRRGDGVPGAACAALAERVRPVRRPHPHGLPVAAHESRHYATEESPTRERGEPQARRELRMRARSLSFALLAFWMCGPGGPSAHAAD